MIEAFNGIERASGANGLKINQAKTKYVYTRLQPNTIRNPETVKSNHRDLLGFPGDLGQ